MTYAPGHTTAHTYPVTGGPGAESTSDKSRVIAAVLQFVVGNVGAGRFYLGCRVLGAAQLILFALITAAVLGLGISADLAYVCAVWGAADAAYIVLGRAHDGQGRRVAA